MTEIKFYACDYDYQKELGCLLYFTNFNLNTCHDLICIIHKCRGDYTVNKDKILVEHIHQNINNLHEFCINNHLNFTIKHNLDYLFSSIYNKTYPIHIDYTCEIKLSKGDDEMTKKRFTLNKDTEWWFVQDNTIQVNEYGYRDDVTGEDKYRGLKQDLTEQEVVDLLNELHDENQELKKALLFFVDVANSECSSNWRKDMENDCQKLFNCSYEEAKEKYGDYDCTWWELGE